MSTLLQKVQLHRIDLCTDSRSTLTALIKLLTPHAPYSLHILGSVLNTVPRTSTLQNIDPSKITLWSTIPFHHDAVLTADPPGLFSIITFSPLDHNFRFFCSGESRTDGPPTEVEEAHIKQVFESLRDIAREAHPVYDSVVTAVEGQYRHRIDTDPPMISIWGTHAKWEHILKSILTSMFPGLRYALPRGTFERDGLPLVVGRWTTVRDGVNGDSQVGEVEVSQISAADLPFVHAASRYPRTEAYIMSRAPCSVCLRLSQGETGAMDGGGQVVACALMHADGSIGALHVDPKYQRQGLGRLVVRALVEKLDLSKDQDEVDSISDEHRDLGGGAIGWNWADVEGLNGTSRGFFTSLGGGEENTWKAHWTFMLVAPSQ